MTSDAFHSKRYPGSRYIIIQDPSSKHKCVCFKRHVIKVGTLPCVMMSVCLSDVDLRYLGQICLGCRRSRNRPARRVSWAVLTEHWWSLNPESPSLIQMEVLAASRWSRTTENRSDCTTASEKGGGRSVWTNLETSLLNALITPLKTKTKQETLNWLMDFIKNSPCS